MAYDIITGDCGFIGSHLADALKKENRDIYGIDIKKGSFSDIRVPFDLPENINTIFHLAALADIVPSIENPRAYYETNVTGTLNVLEAARKSGCKKFIYAASASCYGDNPEIPTHADSDINCRYPYALTKYLGEQLVLHWGQVYKIPVISLRLFNVYGLRSRTSGAYGAMFGTFLAQLANGKPLTIIGDGTQKRDFTHVSDVVRAFIMASGSNCTGVYNIGTGNPVSINKIAELLGAENITYIPKRPGEPEITCSNSYNAQHNFGWKPEISIEDGVKELLEHLDDWKDAPVWTANTIAEATKGWHECLQN